MSTPKRVKTVDSDAIRTWAEARGGVPTIVEQSTEGYHPQPLEIYFNDAPTANTFSRKQIAWDDFFKIMQSRDLAFVYEENGNDPRFHEFVPKNT